MERIPVTKEQMVTGTTMSIFQENVTAKHSQGWKVKPGTITSSEGEWACIMEAVFLEDPPHNPH